MNHFQYFFIGFLFTIQITAQEYVAPQDDLERTDRKLTIEGFSYPTFLDGERHAEFTVGYPISARLEAELQGFYDDYINAEVSRFALRTKYYPGEKFYLYSGMATEFELNSVSGKSGPPRLYMLSGAGYDLSEKLNVELRYDLLFNNAVPTAFGPPSALTVHSKFKF